MVQLAADPVATIVIAAYNAQATILRALRSASAQTAPVEIVVVDDCSGDDTFRIASEYAQTDRRVTVLRHAENKGPAAARNLAIANSSAPWIAVLDADDHMASDRIARLIALADDVDLLADDLYRVTDEDLLATSKRLWSKIDIGAVDISFASFVNGNRRGRHGDRGELGFVKPLMRRSFFAKNDLAYDPALRLAEDYLLYARALAAGARMRLIDPCGYFAVYRADSLSSQHSTADLGAIVAADQALALLPGLAEADRAELRLHRLDARKEWAWRRLIDAVHERDFGAMTRLIVEPPRVSLSLAGKLFEQLWLRSLRRLKLSS
ncbi:glycosyltransferase family 2 protein [Loktanella sp. S4079]|uniref:glycosyltransferase family 2 protein n=1 Tax=Loktanella sp. S4079 TaxID=579483 RepID=UPI000695C090|nr:glycosyltransferase family 2 protein [Loktanella sp. S4079]